MFDSHGNWTPTRQYLSDDETLYDSRCPTCGGRMDGYHFHLHIGHIDPTKSVPSIEEKYFPTRWPAHEAF